jgi:hypothetical protein
MMKITLAVAAAAIILTGTPSAVVSSPVQSETLKLAEVDIGRGKQIEVGPGGVTVGPKKKQRCRTVTTTIERDDGRKVKKTERRCDDD